jgi:SAM-dependent methyltransferase
MSAAGEIDPIAAAGFADAADDYERGRVGYPDAAVDHAFAALRLDAGATLLDLGAGTGKLTRSLLPRAARVVAVDPVAGMLGRLRELLPEADARAGSAEALPLADGEVDAAFAGQAFHWFATPRALEELARVVRPGGGLALLWNTSVWSRSGQPVLTELATLLDAVPTYRLRSGGHDPQGRPWLAVFEAETAPFAPPEQALFTHRAAHGRAVVAAKIASFSYVGALPERERAELMDAVRATLERHPEPVEIGYETEVWTSRRRPEP